MRYVLNYLKANIKIILSVFLIILALVAITVLYQFVIKNPKEEKEYLYSNELSKKVSAGDFDSIDYDLINKDFIDIDNILTEQISLDISNNQKIEYYAIGEKIYDEKIDELSKILEYKLNPEQYTEFRTTIGNFSKDLNFRISEISNANISTIDFQYYKNKYLYEEKQKKCREILEEYKEFLY